MPSGGARQGQPGKSYSNRTDLNVDRAPMPGSSGQMPEQPASGTGSPPILPQDIPSLEEGTQFPDEPVTAGLPFGDGPNSMSAPAGNMQNMLLQAAYLLNPNDPDLKRTIAYMRMNGRA